MRKRTDFEYVLKRRQLTPNDFVVYIKYELNLEKLRELRCQRIEETAQSREEKDAIRNIKACFSRHVCYIFDRALRRFASEASIWADYIGYLKKNSSNTLLNTALGRAIALFPKDENMWIEAAAHEMNNNNSAETARKLLQRALRVNKTGKRLWKRYFELELWNAGRIVNRKKILKIEEAEEARERLRVVSAPLVVFKYAIAAVPEVEFAYELYDLSLSVSEDIADSIMNEMKKTLGHLSSMWAHLSYAEVGKKIRILSMAAEGSAVEPAVEEESSASVTLLSKFAAVSSVLTEGMEILEAGLDSFGVGARKVPEAGVQASSKKKKSKRSADESTYDLSVSTEGTLQCSSADMFMFLESYSKSMHVCIGGVSAIYDQLSAETESFTEEFCAQILAAFRVLDAGLASTKRVLHRMVPVVDSSTEGANSCMLVLCRLRLGILLQFTDYFSSKWFTASTTVAGASSGSKKRKSTSVKSDDRQAIYDDELAITLEGANNWLGLSATAQIQRCEKAVLSMANSLSHYWLVVADAALTYILTASDRYTDFPSDVDSSNPGKFWSCVLSGEGSSGLSDLTDELCKAICRAAEVNFSHASGDSKISTTKVIGKAQDVLMRSSSMSMACDRRIFLSQCLQSAIRSKHISAEDRMYWICEYIKLSYGVLRNMVAVVSSENVRAGRAAYDWCVGALNSMPGILHLHTATKESSSLMTLYDQVFEMEQVDEFLEDRKNNNAKVACDKDKIVFLNKIVESALRDCPSDHSLLDLCAEYYSCTGNHKKANHLRWKKNNSSEAA